MKKFTLFMICSLVVNIITAQWVSNPSVNTLLAGPDTNYAYGEMIANPYDSSYYLLYYKSLLPDPHFQLCMQKVDYRGYKKWGDDGVLISAESYKTWVSKVTLISDLDTCLYVAYTKSQLSLGPTDTLMSIFVNRVTTGGIKLWGEEGIQISDTLDTGSFNPSMLYTDDQNLVLGYESVDTEGTPVGNMVDYKLKKISPSGNILWQYILPRDSNQLNWGGSLHQLTDGNIMLIYRQVNIDFDNQIFSQSLYTQKFDPAGNTLFPQPKHILTYADYYGDYPMTPVHVESNLQDGFYIGVSYDEGALKIQTFIQQIDSDANTLFTEPVALVPDSLDDLDRSYYNMRYLPGSNELLIIWLEKRYGHGVLNDEAILGQKITSAGQRVWPDSGKIFYPRISMMDSLYGYINLKKSGTDETVLFFMKNYLEGDSVIYSFANKYDTDGNSVWGKTILLSSLSGKNIGLSATDKMCDQWVAWWQNKNKLDTAGYSRLFGQNIFADGAIGLGFEDFVLPRTSLKVYPNPASSTLTLDLNLRVPSDLQISLWNTMGQKIHHWSYSGIPGGYSKIQLDITKIPDGAYILTTSTPKGSINLKVVIFR